MRQLSRRERPVLVFAAAANATASGSRGNSSSACAWIPIALINGAKAANTTDSVVGKADDFGNSPTFTLIQQIQNDV